MNNVQLRDIYVLEPAKGGYWEIYDNGEKVWHKNKYPQNYKFNKENDIEFPENNENYSDEILQDEEIDLANQELDIVSYDKSMKIKNPSDYVVPKIDINDGEYIIIKNEGVYQTLPQDPSREVLTFNVELPNKEIKKMSINPTSQKELLMAWGDDSSVWVGKRCLVEIVKQKVFDKMKDVMYLHPEGGSVSAVPEEKVPEKKSKKEA